jgi:hypothetical protein
MPTFNPFTNKTMADRTRQPAIEEAINTAPPPPYTDADADYDFYTSEDHEQQQPHKLTINAEQKVHGTGNLVPINPSTLADASKFSAILFKAIAQLNVAASANADADGATPRLWVDLTINCGVSVVGSRNVVGNVGLKRRASVTKLEGSKGVGSLVLGGEGAVGGAKRRAEDDEVSLVFVILSILSPFCVDEFVLTMIRIGHRC